MRRLALAVRNRKADLLALSIIAAASLVLTWDVVFRGRVLYWGTAILQFQPWHTMVAEALQSGAIPLWMHALGNGAPLLANLQSAVLYPPNLLYLALPAPTAMSVLMLFHIMLAGAFAYLLARYMGLRPGAALVAGLSYGLAGFLVGRSQFGSMTSAYPWLPLSVLAAEWLIRGPALGRAVGLAVTLAVFLLAGHAQMWYYALLLLGAYALWRGWFGPRRTQGRGFGSHLAPLGWFSLSVVGALLLSAAQVLPTAELMLRSQRASGPDYEFAMTYSFWPWRFLTLVMPDLFGNPAHGDFWGYGTYWEDCAYIGLLPLVLALYALYRRVRRRGRTFQVETDSFAWVTPFLAIVIVLSLAMALGSHSPLYLAAYKWFPGVRWFQAPARFLFLFTFAASLLAGYGAQLLLPSVLARRRGRLALVGGIAAVIMVWALRSLLTAVQPTFVSAMFRLAVTIAVIGAWLAFSPLGKESGKRLAWQVGMVAIVAVDLVSFGCVLIPTVPVGAYLQAVELPVALADVAQYRILTTEGYEYDTKFSRYTRMADFGPQDAEVVRGLAATCLPNLCALQGVETASNFEPLVDVRHLTFRESVEAAQRDAQQRLLAAMNVRYVVSRAPMASLQTVWDAPGMAIGENSAAFPRARFATEAEQVTSTQQWEGILKAGDFALDKVWLEEPPMPLRAEGSAPVGVIWHESWNALSMTLATGTEGYLVISETFYPGWKAWDNGSPVPILRGDYAFMAVPIDTPGEHVVELRFQPLSWTVGVAVSAGAFVLTLLAAALSTRARRRHLADSGEQ